ncbi:DNA/RNA polymerase, partial [Ramicandelaber brevisporus]
RRRAPPSLTSMILELHMQTCGDMDPDPHNDPIVLASVPVISGVIVVDPHGHFARLGNPGALVFRVPSEFDLISEICTIVKHVDPDILVGFDVQRSSWGYLLERALFTFNLNLGLSLSRVVSNHEHLAGFGSEHDEWGHNKMSSIHIVGRHVVNLWRVLRSDLESLTSYTLESLVYHMLHIRIPKFSNKTLTQWLSTSEENGAGNSTLLHRWRAVRYYVDRAQYVSSLLDASAMIPRTTEFARIFGINFFSVVTRGSQFKVEAMLLLRMNKPENYVMITPTRAQVAAQRAAECMPLVMEPQTKYFAGPVVVLDFQSLYPSVMIAYNYCYSTCLGRQQQQQQHSHIKRLGVTGYQPEDGMLSLLKDDVIIAPNGVAFVKPHVRCGTLGRGLAEILDTRVMIKSAMKDYSKLAASNTEDDENGDIRGLSRMLDFRQLSLKLIANVTYGYTGAGFSGRMPCSDIADAIVMTGRETLERAIRLIDNSRNGDPSVRRPDWLGAQIVYGDTDSLFIHIPNAATREDAFRIGRDIADTITASNPAPIKLKFEKVYQPCILMSKKRYVGYSYESESQQRGKFDAKGIETVRRDGCGLVQRVMKNSLERLFETQNLTLVKEYLESQWKRVLDDNVNLTELIIAREVRQLSRYKAPRLPPGAVVAARHLQQNPHSEHVHKERVPWVVVHRTADSNRLIDQVVHPNDILFPPASTSNTNINGTVVIDETPPLRINGQWYIQKMINPALNRVFEILGVDVNQWYREMAYKPPNSAVSRIISDRYARSANKAIPHNNTNATTTTATTTAASAPICAACLANPRNSALVLSQTAKQLEYRSIGLQEICSYCAQLPPDSTNTSANSAEDGVSCVSIDCPILFERVAA